MLQGALAGPAAHQGLECAKDELDALAALAALRFAAVPAPPPVLDRRPPPASSHSSGCSDSDEGEGAEQPHQQQQQRCLRKRARSSSRSAGPGGEDAELQQPQQRPARKARALGGSGDALQLQRRSYTWRGLCSRRAEKQLRQLDALHQQQGQAGAAAAPAPAPSSGSASGGGGAPSGGKEADREFAALTTWLRMNVHQPRTARKCVLFVGARDTASGRWTFRLNPLLSWAEVSPETRARLRHLPAEAAQAFAAKYRGRPREEWRLKCQRYRPPGSSATHLVCLDDLVTSLHAVWAAHEGPASAAAVTGAATPSAAASAAQPAAAAAELASCGSSARAAAAHA